METFFYVGIGGFLGANLRYYIANYLTKQWLSLTGWSFPLGTLFVNITGSFFLAIFSIWLMQRVGISDNVRLLIGTGFFGAYTTFSTFANETIQLATQHHLTHAILYVIATNVTCLMGVVLGLVLAQRLFTST